MTIEWAFLLFIMHCLMEREFEVDKSTMELLMANPYFQQKCKVGEIDR